MQPSTNLAWTAVAVVVLAGLALADLHRVESGSLVIYTTPALRDYLEGKVIPAWKAQGGLGIEPVYITAGEQYSRLRMSGTSPEADLFVHASPLYLEKGFSDGYFVAIDPTAETDIDAAYRSAPVLGGYSWVAFAWSPLVEVYSPKLPTLPDLATAELTYGIAHPILSNNGIYSALFLEALSPAGGAHAIERTVVQPVNARTNIIGVSDGSFDVTLGYEGVAKFYLDKGAKIAFATPLVDGQRATTPVLFAASVVKGGREPTARAFIDFLLTPAMQAATQAVSFRSVVGSAPPAALLAPVRVVPLDWSDWRTMESILPRYEVGSRG